MTSAVVIGASFAGLLTAAALMRSGLEVTVLERDRLDGEQPARPRSGVPQSGHPHILLRRGLMAIDALLPGVESDLLAAGGVPFNTAEMPWLGEFGWNPRTDWAYDIISIGRPALEAIVRRRVTALPHLEIVDQTRVEGLRRMNGGWQVEVGNLASRVYGADLVVDASGRGSRLPHWLADFGVAVPEAEMIEAKVGYATRAYRGRTSFRLGVAITPTTDIPRGGMALPIQDDGWLVCALGYGEQRPGRSPEEFEGFLRGLRDPALVDLVDQLEPMGDVVVHRQTANRRTAYERVRGWPAGLLVTGDARCAFNPVYGQGITVAACQAQVLLSWLRRQRMVFDGAATRTLLRRMAAITELPWAMATTEDLRMPSCALDQSPMQRLTTAWTSRMAQLVAGGDESCARAFGRTYHLMGSPLALISPPVIAAVARSFVVGVPPSALRPNVLVSPA